MKKTITLIWALFALCQIHAQEQGSFELGTHLGINFSNVAVSGTDVGQTTSRISWNAALIGEYYFSDRWGIKAKVILDNKGWADSFIFDEDNGNTREGDAVLKYTSIPLMANWHFGQKRNWYLHFGFYAAFLSTAEIADIEVTETYEDTDFGLALGIGVKIPVSERAKIFFEYDAHSGFSNIVKISNDGVSARNGRSALNVGVLFNL